MRPGRFGPGDKQGESNGSWIESGFNEARALWPGRLGRDVGDLHEFTTRFNEARALWPGRYAGVVRGLQRDLASMRPGRFGPGDWAAMSAISTSSPPASMRPGRFGPGDTRGLCGGCNATWLQ